MPIQIVQAAPDHRWWPAVADHVVRLSGDAGMPDGDLRAVTVLAPRASDAPHLYRALRALHPVGSAWYGPRITTLERWVGGVDADRVQRLVELFEALRTSEWARSAFGGRPGALWALAGELAQLSDELTLAAVGEDERFEGRWMASVQRHFRRRAARPASVQAQLVLQVWKAQISDRFGAGRLLKRWSERVAGGCGPLILLAPFSLPSWQRKLLDRLDERCTALLVQADLGRVVHGRWLQLAWPELTEPGLPLAPIALRGEAARDLPAPQFRILKSDSLEHEAVSAARQVLDWLELGHGRIALVALDRLAARRVRALLERAQVLVADQSGWKLSTTSAAAAVMRLLDLVAGDFRVRDLLDWLRSPFAWWGRPQRLEAAGLIDRLARRHAVAGGLKSLERLLLRCAAAPQLAAAGDALGHADAQADGVGAAASAEAQRALAILGQLQVHSRQLRAEHAPDRLARALAAALEALGMAEALRADPIGIDVLDEFERLRCRLPGAPAALSLGEFRELVAQHFENANASDPAIESPVVMTSLAGACQRDFDAVLLLGAGAEHLPRAPAAGTLMSRAVRHDLGLPTQADDFELQHRQLALLLATAPRSAATWRCMESDEPRPLSVWLDRLRELALRAGWADPVCAPPSAARSVVPAVAHRPAPMAAGMLPTRLSASACQSLIDCPYQFFGRYLLGLRRRDPLDPAADKRDLGVALHAIVHRLHRRHDDCAIASMADADLERTLAALADEQFGRDMPHRPALIAYRQRTLELIPSYIAWLRERAVGGRQLQGTECDFDRPLELDDGSVVRLTGRIDQVDRHPDGSLEVIDLKVRSHAAVRKDARDPGERIQLPFYALALGPPTQHASYLSFERDSDPLKRRTRSVQAIKVGDPLQPWVELLERRLQDMLGRVRHGAALPALGVEPACAYCEMRGLCRRNEWAQGPA